MIISLDGPDNIGKTTLAKDLARNNYVRYRHFGRVENHKEGLRVIKTFIDSLERKKNYILDRSPLEEFVYGFYRGYDPYPSWPKVKQWIKDSGQIWRFVFFFADEKTYAKFKLPHKNDVEVEFQKHDQAFNVSMRMLLLARELQKIKDVHCIFVHCNHFQTFDQRNEWINEKLAGQYPVRQGYNNTIFSPAANVINFSPFQTISFYPPCPDYKKCPLGKEHRTSAFGLKHHLPTSGAGVTNPRWILVSEAPGRGGCGTYGIPFYGDRSGVMLHKAVEELGIWPTDMYITNVVKCCPEKNDLGKFYNVKERAKLDCVKRLKKELEITGRGTRCDVIAMGRVAEATLQDLDIPHQFVYHPAYYLRRGDMVSFKKDLKAVMQKRLFIS
jgi:uracil-DNA glycosylase family 4